MQLDFSVTLELDVEEGFPLEDLKALVLEQLKASEPYLKAFAALDDKHFNSEVHPIAKLRKWQVLAQILP